MKTATIQELKQELHSLSPARLLELCLRLAKFKKDNKELLTYLLFEAHDEGFAELPKTNVYLTKKSLRKTLRLTNKYIRYAGSKQVEVALLIYACRQLKTSGLPYQKNTVLANIYQALLKKIESALQALHEDLQYDYQQELNSL